MTAEFIVPPSFAEVLDQVDVKPEVAPTDGGKPPSLAFVLQEQLHDLVARVRKDGVDGRLALVLLVERCKEGVSIAGKTKATTVANLGEAKAPGNVFKSKRYGQLELFNSLTPDAMADGDNKQP